MSHFLTKTCPRRYAYFFYMVSWVPIVGALIFSLTSGSMGLRKAQVRVTRNHRNCVDAALGTMRLTGMVRTGPCTQPSVGAPAARHRGAPRARRRAPTRVQDGRKKGTKSSAFSGPPEALVGEGQTTWDHKIEVFRPHAPPCEGSDEGHASTAATRARDAEGPPRLLHHSAASALRP